MHHMSLEPSGDGGTAFCRGGKTRVKAERGNNLPNKANASKWLSQERIQLFNTYLVSYHFSWGSFRSPP